MSVRTTKKNSASTTCVSEALTVFIYLFLNRIDSSNIGIEHTILRLAD